MSATTETLAFSIGLQVGNAACTPDEKLLALARAGLQATGPLGLASDEVGVRRAMMTFQGAADSLKAELRVRRRVA